MAFCLAERNLGDLCNFGRGQHENHFYEIILNLDQLFKRCHIKLFLI